MINKTLLPLFLFFAVSAYAQNTIEAKELSKKEILDDADNLKIGNYGNK